MTISDVHRDTYDGRGRRIERLRGQGRAISAFVTVVVVVAILLVEFAGLSGGWVEAGGLVALIGAIGYVACWS
jgi:hypothetical protein